MALLGGSVTGILVLQRIRYYCDNHASLLPERILKRDKALYNAARLHFGSWSAALQATGIVNKFSPHRPRRHDRAAIITALRKRHEAGLSLIWAVACLEDFALARAAKDAFKSWRRALNSAGLPQMPREITKTNGRVN